MKLKKILIVGLGPMGRSHFLSFYKKRYSIDLCDKKISNLPIRIDKNDKNVDLLPVIPKDKTYDLAIISTNSLERIKVINSVLKRNKVKNLLLEKFIFPKKNDFSIFSKLVKKYNVKKIRVNTWGSFLINRFNLNNLNDQQFSLNCDLVKGSLGTNLLHVLDLFCTLTKNKNIYFKKKPVKVINSKRKGYQEIVADLEAYNENGAIKITAKNNRKYHILNMKDKNNNYIIHINKSSKCILYKNKKKLKIINFPYAKNFTEAFFRRCSIKKENFSNYDLVSKLSLEILRFIQKQNRKRIILT